MCLISPLEPLRMPFKGVKVRFETLANWNRSRRQFASLIFVRICNKDFRRVNVG